MSREEAAYGITTYPVVLAAGAIQGFSMAPAIVWSQIRQISGGSLVVGSISITGGSTLAAVGALVPTGAVCPTEIKGPAGFALAAVGATAVGTVIQGVSQGFTGYVSSNVY